MRTLGGIVSLALAAPALANDTVDSAIYATTTTRQPNSGWVVRFPTGSANYFNSIFDVAAGIGNAESPAIADGLPVTSIAVSVADFGSGRTYATLGVYASNLALDGAGATPDLASPVAEAFSPPLIPPPNLFDYVVFDLADGAIPGGQTKLHAVNQLPPGDSGLLGLGADSVGTGPRGAFTTDGYVTPALVISFLELGLDPGQDNTATTACSPAARLPHGRLRATSNPQVGSGDHLTTNVKPEDVLQLAFCGTNGGDQLRLYMNVAPCSPSVPIGPVLPTIPDADGDGSYLRVSAVWPSGFGGQTLRISAAWGNPACSNPGAGFTNCVTLVTLVEPTFGTLDDGTIESGWVAQLPSGPSDYFNNNFGNGTGKNGVVGLTVAVLDFASATPAFPSAGVSNANFTVDPTGQTPDVSGPGVLAVVAPFTFPPGAYETTSAQYTRHAVGVAGSLLGTSVHGWMQFPPGDPGRISVGADTSSPSYGYSGWSSNGYVSPARIASYANWGIRIATN